MSDIGSAHGGKTPAQVAINWTMCKGAIPIVGELLRFIHVDKVFSPLGGCSFCPQHCCKFLLEDLNTLRLVLSFNCCKLHTCSSLYLYLLHFLHNFLVVMVCLCLCHGPCTICNVRLYRSVINHLTSNSDPFPILTLNCPLIGCAQLDVLNELQRIVLCYKQPYVSCFPSQAPPPFPALSSPSACPSSPPASGAPVFASCPVSPCCLICMIRHSLLHNSAHAPNNFTRLHGMQGSTSAFNCAQCRNLPSKLMICEAWYMRLIMLSVCVQV